MKTIFKFISILSLITLLALTFATPAYAFDGRSGENVVIKSNEVIEDDVYVTANNFVLDGTVKGDLVVFGETITINGTVDGDLMAAGQTVIINGRLRTMPVSLVLCSKSAKPLLLATMLLLGVQVSKHRKAASLKANLSSAPGKSCLMAVSQAMCRQVLVH